MDNPAHQNSPQPRPADRRQFVAACCAAVAATAAAAVPVAAGLGVLTDPVRRHVGGGGFLKVATLAALPEDGTPRKFPVVATRVDAWSRSPGVPVGAVYLRRVQGARVEALNVSCPHAGCSVDFDADRHQFRCPCHDSLFGIDGGITDRRSPSARPLDALEVQVREGGEVWVRFQNFRAGTAQKIPIA